MGARDIFLIMVRLIPPPTNAITTKIYWWGVEQELGGRERGGRERENVCEFHVCAFFQWERECVYMYLQKAPCSSSRDFKIVFITYTTLIKDTS